MGKTRASHVPPQSHDSPQPHQERSSSPSKDADPLKITAQPNDPINSTSSDPLAAIAARLEALDELRDKVNALEARTVGPQRQHRKARNYNQDSDGESDYYQRQTRLPYAKLDFPKFEGGDPRGWVLKAEKFFNYYNTSDDDKVDVAALYLEGDALDLFSWLTSKRTLRYWEDLVSALQEHFGPPEYLNPDEHLSSIRQTGTVQEFRQEWAKRVARVSNWPEHCLLGVFLMGLSEELRSDVRIQKPRTVYRAASLALEFEQQRTISRKSKHTVTGPPIKPSAAYPTTSSTHDGFSASKQFPPSSSTNNYQPPSSATSAASPISNRANPVDLERQRRRERGLCFRCAAPYRPGHQCSAASFALLEVNEDGNPLKGNTVECEVEECYGTLTEYPD